MVLDNADDAAVMFEFVEWGDYYAHDRGHDHSHDHSSDVDDPLTLRLPPIVFPLVDRDYVAQSRGAGEITGVWRRYMS